MINSKDHGGNLDAAAALYGGVRRDWIDLSTGINPVPFPIPDMSVDDWTALPDQGAYDRLIRAARHFWNVPDESAVLAAAGCSSLIAQIPTLRPATAVKIIQETYNEHRAAFCFHGWNVSTSQANAQVIVHPNNPTGDFTSVLPHSDFTIIDESFCDIAPTRSLISQSAKPGVIVLKSFGKFWGLAGVRLGFVIGDPALVHDLQQRLGPWAVSGPALKIGEAALNDMEWAEKTRANLQADMCRLDALLMCLGAKPMGDVSLFRTYEMQDAQNLHERLAQAHIWTRVFPYASNWIRFGLPAPDQWSRLEAAL